MNTADVSTCLYLAAHDLWRGQKTWKDGAGLSMAMQVPHPASGQINLSSILLFTGSILDKCLLL